MEKVDLASQVTIIITTSAVKSNPQTELIEEVVDSLSFIRPSVKDCRKIIVCDAIASQSTDAKPLWKSGRVPADNFLFYDQYIENLRVLCREGKGEFKNAEVLALPDRHGFGHGVLSAVNITTTPFVLVLQHDRRFIECISLDAVIRDMNFHHGSYVDYVCDQLGDRLSPNGTPIPDVNTATLPFPIITREALTAGHACPYAIYYPTHSNSKLKYDPPSDLFPVKKIDHEQVDQVELCEKQIERLGRVNKTVGESSTLSGGKMGGYVVSEEPEHIKNSRYYAPHDHVLDLLRSKAPCKTKHKEPEYKETSTDTNSECEMKENTCDINHINNTNTNTTTHVNNAPNRLMTPTEYPGVSHHTYNNPTLLTYYEFNKRSANGENPLDLMKSSYYTQEYPFPLPVHCVTFTTPYTNNYTSRYISKFPGRVAKGALSAPYSYLNLLQRVLEGGVDDEGKSGVEYFYCDCAQCMADSSTDSSYTFDIVDAVAVAAEDAANAANTDGSPKQISSNTQPDQYTRKKIINLAKETPLVSPRLMPLYYWFDSTHLARTEYYKTVLFNRWKTQKLELVRKGEFTEDKLIQLATRVLVNGIEQEKKAKMGQDAIVTRYMNHDSGLNAAKSTITVTRDGNVLKSADHLTGKQWQRKATGDIWRDFECTAQTKDLRIIADALTEGDETETIYGAHHVLQREFGIYLYEQLDGLVYTDQNNWLEPKWWHEEKIEYMKRMNHKTPDSTSGKYCCIKQSDNKDSNEDTSTICDRCNPHVNICDRCNPHVNPDGQVDLVHGRNNPISSSEYVYPAPGFVFGSSVLNTVRHLDGKAFWSEVQRKNKGFASKK